LNGFTESNGVRVEVDCLVGGTKTPGVVKSV
jgi:hypothetical protein